MTIRLHAEHALLSSSHPHEEAPQHTLSAVDGLDFDKGAHVVENYDDVSVRFPAVRAKSSDVESYVSDATAPRPVTPPPSPPSRRRVRFASSPVSCVWTRPYTKVQDVPTLFYSSEETAAFRQEYRMERKLLAAAAAQAGEGHQQQASIVQQPLAKRSKRSISMVVVMHNDTLETFTADAGQSCEGEPLDSNSDVSFDNDSFWSGSITWF